jgi:hypothetical protein
MRVCLRTDGFLWEQKNQLTPIVNIWLSRDIFVVLKTHLLHLSSEHSLAVPALEAVLRMEAVRMEVLVGPAAGGVVIQSTR